MTTHHLETVLSASQRALATYGVMGLNVVPVSVVTAENSDLILYDFFMGKSVANIQDTTTASLAVWDGLVGIQIRGRATYEQVGDTFTAAVTIMKERFPDRTLRGIIRFTPESVYSVSAGDEAGKKLA